MLLSGLMATQLNDGSMNPQACMDQNHVSIPAQMHLIMIYKVSKLWVLFSDNFSLVTNFCYLVIEDVIHLMHHSHHYRCNSQHLISIVTTFRLIISMWFNCILSYCSRTLQKIYQIIFISAYATPRWISKPSCCNLQPPCVKCNQIYINSGHDLSIHPSFMEGYNIVCECSHNLIGLVATICT